MSDLRLEKTKEQSPIRPVVTGVSIGAVAAVALGLTVRFALHKSRMDAVLWGGSGGVVTAGVAYLLSGRTEGSSRSQSAAPLSGDEDQLEVTIDQLRDYCQTYRPPLSRRARGEVRVYDPQPSFDAKILSYLKGGGDPGETILVDGEPWPLVAVAALYDCPQAVRRLLTDERVDKQWTSGGGNTLLHIAAQYGRRELVVNVVCKSGCENQTNSEGLTPLDLVCDDQGRKEIAIYLGLNIGSYSKLRTDRLYTYLHNRAVQVATGHRPQGDGVEGVKWFVDNGARLDLAWIVEPAQSKDLVLVQLFLERGAPAEQIAKALQVAHNGDWGEGIELLGQALKSRVNIEYDEIASPLNSLTAEERTAALDTLFLFYLNSGGDRDSKIGVCNGTDLRVLAQRHGCQRTLDLLDATTE